LLPVIRADFTYALPALSQSKRPVETCRKASENLPESKVKDGRFNAKQRYF